MIELAILGGEPVRKEPFLSSVVVDEHERQYLMEVINRKEFSRFMGSPTNDMERLLFMTSEEAEHHEDQYFSFLGGRMVRKFEAEFARKFGVPYAISVNSATSGLAAALGAAGLGPGDEVITTSMSFNATAISILLFNSIPVFVDVDQNTFCLNPAEVERAISPKTKAILVVHLLGNAANMEKILAIAQKNNLVVIEDCAQAPGTMYKGEYVGTIGNLGVFSFQETKNITTGEGGMVITKDPGLAKKVRLIRNHGESIPDNSWDDQMLVNLVGMNFRMTELTAALGVAQLIKLDENNRVRTENAHLLVDQLKDIPGLSVPSYPAGVVPHVFPLLYDAGTTGVSRDRILAALRAEGIPVGSGYLRLMNENPIFLKKIAYGQDHCPWSCHLYNRPRSYQSANCPVAENLLRDRFIWFYHIHRPNGSAEMADVVRAFKKVLHNMEALKQIDINTEVPYKW
jgi:perosamine synthetase